MRGPRSLARRGSVLPLVIGLVAVASYHSLEAGIAWEGRLRRDREEELAFRLAHLQRAIDEFKILAGRDPKDAAEVAQWPGATVARIPLDPLDGRRPWRLENNGGRLEVHCGGDGEAADGSRYRDWVARRQGTSWIVTHGGEAR